MAKSKKKNAKEKQSRKLKRKGYEAEMEKLQMELVRLQEWVKHSGEKIIIIFEGRDAAGKGGVIKRITERVSPRIYRVVALPAPSDREKSQMFGQRYIQHFPSAGEIVIFDRSWYNRSGVERVMGYCSEEEYERFLKNTPVFENAVVSNGIRLIKYFFDVSQKEQKRRFLQRVKDPMRQWKLSPMDIESYRRWWDYTAAYDRMLKATDTKFAPWYVVPSDDKRLARLNCIRHLLSMIPYKKVPFKAPRLPERSKRSKGTPKQPKHSNCIPEYY